MKYTLRETDPNLWVWTYCRNQFFFSGVSHSRRDAIVRLLNARAEAREATQALQEWLGTIPKQQRRLAA